MEFKEATELIIESFTRGSIYTAIPATVTGVTDFGSLQMVDTQPLIDRLYDDNTIVEPAPILNVPVVYPGGGGGLLSFPLAIGNGVLLIFSMRDHDNWSLSDGTGRVTPETSRHHSVTDAIAIPGLFTRSSNLSPNTTDVELKFNGLSIKLEKATGDTTIANATHSLKLKSNGDVLHSSGAKITAAGDVITDTGISLKTHTHPQGNDSNGDTQVDTGVAQ